MFFYIGDKSYTPKDYAEAKGACFFFANPFEYPTTKIKHFICVILIWWQFLSLVENHKVLTFKAHHILAH